MKKKGVIIFDFDGVIVDSTKLTYQYVKRSVPFLSWGMYQRIFDHPTFLKVTRSYTKLFRKKDTKAFQERRVEYMAEKLGTSSLIPGIDVLLRDLHTEYTLAINTNANVPGTIPLLEKYNIKDYFSIIKTRDDSFFKVEKITQILEELHADSNKALFITDSYRDVLDAKIAGIKSIGVLTGMHTRKHFEQKNIAGSVVCIAENTEELENCIDSYFKNKDNKNEENKNT